ncbi:MAG: hypothetical protein V1855_04050 [bacterium]
MKANIAIVSIFTWVSIFFIPLLSSQEKDLEDFLSLKSTTTWKEFCLEQKPSDKQKEKWVWVSSITFKSKEALTLKTLRIQWMGKQIDALSAALFVKKINEPCVIPIEKNLICDGTWDNKNQQIIFYLNEKIIATNNYHLVLSFPQSIESSLKNGKFILSKKNLANFSLQNNK